MPEVREDIPPTDARLFESRPRGAALERMMAEAERRRFEALEHAQRLARPGVVAASPRQIFVKPSRPNRRVPMERGGFYPQEGMQVSVNDIWAIRRIRDGSLVVTEAAPPAPAPQPGEEGYRGPSEEPQEEVVEEPAEGSSE